MDRRTGIVLLALLGLALARYIAVAFYIHPFADDFSYAVAGMRTDLLPRLWDEYNLWNGRWFSNILVLRGPLVLGMEKGLGFYRLVPVALLALTWLGAFALIRGLAVKIGRGKAVIGAALFLLLYLQLMPDLSEGIYWYTGAVSYQLPGALTLFLLASWARVLRKAEKATAPVIVFHALLAAIIVGCNELHMVFMVLVHGALLFFRWRGARRWDRAVLIVLMVVVIASMVVILAPGNAGRSGQFPHRHELFRSLGWGALQTVRFLGTWILSPALLLASLLYLSMSGWLQDRVPMIARGFGIRPGFAIAVLVFATFTAMVLPYWATGLLGQHRTVNATLLLILPWWFVTLSSIDFHGWGRIRERMAPRFVLIACALLAITVFFTGSGGRLSMDITSGRLARFDGALQARYQRIEQAQRRGDDEVVLDRVDGIPRSLRYLDGDRDPAQWTNRSIAYYFRSDSMEIRIGSSLNGIRGSEATR